jgi:hypothetical protein
MLGDPEHLRAMRLLPFAAAVVALTLNRQSVVARSLGSAGLNGYYVFRHPVKSTAGREQKRATAPDFITLWRCATDC